MRVSGCRRCVLQGVEHWTDCSWVTEVGPPPPAPRFTVSDLMHISRTNTLQPHKNVQSGFETEAKQLHCDPDFRPFDEFIKAAGCDFKSVLQKQGDLQRLDGKKWSHFFSFVSLWSALTSVSLLSGNQMSFLHRSACHPFFIQQTTASICTFLLFYPSTVHPLQTHKCTGLHSMITTDLSKQK